MRRLARVALATALGGGVVALIASGAVPCQFARVTGCPCPGCGLTRATLAILRGDLAAAFAMQPFAFVVSPLLAIAAIALASVWVTGEPLRGGARLGVWLGALVGVLAVSMIAFWAARFFGFWGGPAPV